MTPTCVRLRPFIAATTTHKCNKKKKNYKELAYMYLVTLNPNSSSQHENVEYPEPSFKERSGQKNYTVK